MGYILKNTSGLINTRLTDTGRQYLSEGNFNITYFQIGDSEVCYDCAPGVLESDGFVLEPSYNAQNSTGIPQSNKEEIKYPFYLEGSEGNTYGVPTRQSTDQPIYNFTDELGFFTGTTGSYSAITNSAYTISCNYITSLSNFTSGNTLTIGLDVVDCSPSTGTPEENQFIAINFEPNVGCGEIIPNYQILFYKIQSVVNLGGGSYTLTLDRNIPDLVGQGCDNGDARICIYPSGMTPFYYSEVPTEYFCKDCGTGATTNVWNMNIPWSESPAGVFSTINEDYTKYGSVNYLGTKEYLGYQTNAGQVFENYSGVTAVTDTFYYNSFDERINVEPKDQKAIAIVHYTNSSVVQYYGEKFAVEPYDSADPLEAGYARNFRIDIPTLMWHKTTGSTIGQSFYIDPIGYDLLEPSYMLSLKNEDMNLPGMRYYHLYDNNPDANNNLNRVGKVFPDAELVIFDDEEIVAALSYKSNRNWTLPAPKLGLLTPNACDSCPGIDGILSGDNQTMWVTYRFNSSAFTDSLHCNYYSSVEGPSSGCSITSQNVTVRFGNEFPFLSQDCTGFSANDIVILAQITDTGERPDPALWREINVTSQISGTSVNGYLTASGLTNNTFVICPSDYSGATFYDLNNYIDIPMNGETNKLNFGDEYFFYGNVSADIQGTIYEMKYAINLQEEQFQNSTNPTSTPNGTFYITEIGLYNLNKDLMILSKLQYPILRQGIQQFLIKYDF
jgi:hypothetical protein